VDVVTYDMLKFAVEQVLKKIKEGKKLGTGDLFILYLGTITGELKERRSPGWRKKSKRQTNA
jgi:hypothetical protein